MVDIGGFLTDPFTIRSIISVVAGALTGLLVVRLTFYLRNKRDLFNAIRAIRAELEYNLDQLAKLTRLLEDDMRTQQVDRPLDIPAGTAIEFRYVLTLPSSLNTAAFDQLTQSGQLTSLPSDLRRQLFDLYDIIDRINRLHRHRETLHYSNLGNVHIHVDTSGLDVEPGGSVEEADLPEEVRTSLSTLRRLRRATTGINRQILRLVAVISSRDEIAELGLEPYVDPGRDGARPTGGSERGRGRERGRDDDVPDIETMIRRLDEVERESFWSRLV